jgi:hypothetical protein
MPNMDRSKRDELSALVGRLDFLRIVADYRPSVPVEDQDVREAIAIMERIVNAF